MTTDEKTLDAWRALLGGGLRRGERVVLPVLSGSMAPLMPVGAEVVIAGAAWAGLRPGDVAVFRAGQTLTAHRVLLLLPLPGRPLMYQKGDALTRGAWIDGRRVVGVVVAVTLPGGAPHPLTDPATRAVAARLARRQLRWDLGRRIRRQEGLTGPADRASGGPDDPRRGTLVTLTAVPAPRPGCRLRELGGTIGVVAPDGVAYHALDGPGGFIWRLLDGRRQLAEIAALLCDEYEVGPGVAAADLLRFVDRLSAAGLVELAWPDGTDSPPAP